MKLSNAADYRIDPRSDIHIIKEQAPDTVQYRTPSPEEMKKVSRWLREDKLILKTHKELNDQEAVIFNSKDKNIHEAIDQPQGLVTKLMGYQLYGVKWMIEKENSNVSGGILADEMGMGKTLQMLGLILHGNVNEVTLVVLPAVAMKQWIEEIGTHAPGMFNILVHHGRSKLDNNDQIDNVLKRIVNAESSNEVLSTHVRADGLFNEGLSVNRYKYTIVFTTYGTIESDYRRKCSFLHRLEFHRLVLDEAHYIKDARSSTNMAISLINSKKRWGLTGTPIHNRVGDLFALVKFLRLDPQSYYFCKKCPCKSIYWLRCDEFRDGLKSRGYCPCGHFSSVHFRWWNRRIATPIQMFGYTEMGKEIFDKLHQLTSKIILRRTKYGIEKELGLPSKVVLIVRNLFSPSELDFYTGLYSETQGRFMDYAIKGQVMNNYAHIFDLLQKMRLAVNHPYLVYKNENGLFGNVPICGYCNEEADDPILSKCKHIFCREEARRFLEMSNTCPVCKVKITIDLNQTKEFEYQIPVYTENWRSSTKIEYLVQELILQKSRYVLNKSLVFSQFVNFLEILRWRLERAGFRCVKIYGSMPLSQRKAAIDAFNTDSSVTVFLISLKAGGVALNLTEATNVYLMDLWWNPAVEEQAMDRIHRIGQHRPIRIHRVIIENSIESRILTLQKKKKALFDSAVENDHTALQRLTEDDLMFLFS